MIASTGDWTGLGYTWTLAVEQQFYLVFAILMLLVPAHLHRSFLGWTAVVLFLIGQAVMLSGAVSLFVFYRMPLIGFMLASAGGWAALSAVDPPRWWAALRRGWIAALVALLVVPLALMPASFMDAHRVLNILHGLFIAIGLTLLVSWVATNQAAFAVRMLDASLLRFYGAISYSLYLIHGILVYWLKPIWPTFSSLPHIAAFAASRLSLFIVVLLGVTVLAKLSLTYIERPMMRFGHKRAVQRH